MSERQWVAGARPITRRIPGREVTALMIYIGVMAVLVSVATALLLDLANRRAALEESRNTLARLQQRLPSEDATSAPADMQQFLTGATITIAGAALQERVAAAAKKVGATILSSQIDLQGPRAAEGFVGLSDRLQVRQPGLQPLLYDLEAGPPCLFVDSLEVDSPIGFGEDETGPMRVTMGVTGQWRNAQ